MGANASMETRGREPAGRPAPGTRPAPARARPQSAASRTLALAPAWSSGAQLQRCACGGASKEEEPVARAGGGNG